MLTDTNLSVSSLQNSKNFTIMEKKEETFDEKKIREAANYDLKMAIAFLNMVYRDPVLLGALEDLIVERGRAHHENKKANPELEFQK